MRAPSAKWFASGQFTLLAIVTGLTLMVAGLWLWPLMWVGGVLLFATGIIPFLTLTGPSQRESDAVEDSPPASGPSTHRRSERID